MKRFKFVPFVILFLVLTLTIGFSAMNRNLMVRDLGAQIRIIKDIRITNITPNGSTSDGLAISEDYNVNNITPNFSLPNSDSTVTYTVEVTNIGNQKMGIAEITGCPSNLVCEVSNYQMTEPLCDDNNSSKCSLGAVKTFNITMKYAGGAYDANNTSFDLLLEFDFRGYHNVTYVNAPRGNNYKTYAMDNINFVQAYQPAGGGFATYTASGTSVSGTNWNLTNKIVTVPADKVTDDITIRFRPLGEYINKLYADGAKSTVSNGGTIGSSSYTYNRVTSLGLINDREGGRASDPDGGNVRYYGTSANNYIYYNCSDYSNQSDSTCEKWRIIGVFNGKVKIINTTSIGTFSYDPSSNVWSTSAMRKLLNSGYSGESVNNSLYWNRSSGKCYTTEAGLFQSVKQVDCSFTSNGLRDGDTKDFISDETVYFTGPQNALLSISDMYYQEHNNGSLRNGAERSWTGKVMLPYATDYYYSANLSNCTSNIYWLGTGCANTSWMKQSNKMWVTTPGYSGTSNMWIIEASSKANYNDVYEGYAVLPTMYLYANTIFIDGEGTNAKPYKIYPLA